MTNESASNPYAPPKANLDEPVGLATFEAFPRFSTWWVLLLTGVTFGIYHEYWLFSRTRTLNQISPSKPIAVALMVTAMAFFAAYLVGDVLAGIYPDQPGVKAMSSALLLAAGIGDLVWVFAFRNRLNERSASQPGDRYWLSGPLTFFLRGLYLQYKLNQLIDRERSATRPGPLSAGLAAQRA